MTEDERQIRDLVDGWMTASKAGDLSAVLALMSDDVVFLTPGREPFGKSQFAADSQAMRDLKMDGTAEIQELKILGDHAYIRNYISVTITTPDGSARRMAGHTLSILVKGSDGIWRLTRDANLVAPAG